MGVVYAKYKLLFESGPKCEKNLHWNQFVPPALSAKGRGRNQFVNKFKFIR